MQVAGACQDQRAGRPKGNQSVQQTEASVVSQKSLGGGAWGPGLGAGGAGGWAGDFSSFLKSLLGGGRRGGRRLQRWEPGGKQARDTPPTPPPPAL